MKKIFWILFFLSVESFAQTQTKNYVVEQSFNVSQTSTAVANNLSIPDVIKTVTYLDGLGRTSQVINVQFTDDWAGYDLVQPSEYDDLGRSVKHYLPYVSSTNDGTFQFNYSSDQYNYYQSAVKVAHDPRPFGESAFESSSLSRVIEMSPPGNSWVMGSGHTQTFEYLFNIDAEVVKWEVQFDGSGNPTGASMNGTWAPGGLNVLKTKDEDGKINREFKDFSGKTVCKRIDAYTDDATNQTLDFTNGTNSIAIGGGSVKQYSSFNVYDDLGHLIYFLPTGYVALNQNSFSESSQEFEDLIYAYHYDDKGRQIAKHVPGAGWSYIVYNNRDLPILTQSQNEKLQNIWLFSKYDDLGREIMTGTCHPSDNAGHQLYDWQQIQDVVNQESTYSERRVNQHLGNYLESYTCDAYPRINMIREVYTVNYCDDYDLVLDPVLNNRPFIPTATYSDFSRNVLGLTLASKVLVLGTSNYLYTINYYNDKGQLIQQQQQTQLDYPNSWDVINTEYFFNDKIKSVNRNHASLNSTNISINTHYWYDHLGRLLDIFKQVNSEPEIHMVFNQYNGIGQLVRKHLHYDWVWNDPYLQGIDYRFNIRGWLSSINNDELSNDGGIKNEDNNDFFGEEIFYDNADIVNNVFNSVSQFNGNISAIKWRSRSALWLPFKYRPIHSYSYRYDDFNRLTAAYYAANTDASPNVFDNNINFYLEKESYDLPGNIHSLIRNSNSTVDDLTYSYQNNSNQISSVADASGYQIGNDFHDQASNSSEYAYDMNGNLTKDDNKQISNITYNYLNLPESITSNGNTVTYTYDASGVKLSKTFNGVTHYYVNGIEYEKNNLLFISTEEGRIRHKFPDATNHDEYVYDYFLKDHLGNVRVVLTTEERKDDYYATMELANRAAEDSLFKNVSSTSGDKPANEPPDPAYSPDQKVSHLNYALGSDIGVSKVLHVKGKDILDFGVKYFFDNAQPINAPISVTNLLTQLANNFVLTSGSVAGSTPEVQQQWAQNTFTNNSGISNFLTSSLGDGNINDPSKPQAFLVYLFFDEKFNFHPEASGLMQASQANTLADLVMLDLEMPDNGYFYIYTNNRSNASINFNDLQIHQHTGVILEEDHYYPYGLLIEPISFSDPSYFQHYKCQDKELQNDLSQNLLDFEARQYDAVLGRWWVQDPVHQVSCPYLAFGDNPASFIDPDGQFFFIPFLIGAAVGGFMGYNAGKSAGVTGDGLIGYALGGALIGGFSANLGAGIATSSMAFANTASIATASFCSSLGMNILSGGKSDVCVDFGIGSFDLTKGSFGYLGKKGNSFLENLGYSLGAIANIQDAFAGLHPGEAKLQTENESNEGGVDKIGHTEVTDNDGNPLVDFGPKNANDGHYWFFSDGRNDWTSFASKGEINQVIKNENNIYKSAISIKGVNLKKLASISQNLNSNPGKYNFVLRSCSSVASRSLFRSGVYLFGGIHPYTLRLSLMLRNIGIRPSLFSYEFTHQN